MTKLAIAAITLTIAVLAVMLAVAPTTATESAEEERRTLREDISRATSARNGYQAESDALVRIRDAWIQEIRDWYGSRIESADNQVRIWNNAIAELTKKLEALTPPPTTTTTTAATAAPPELGCVIEPCETTTTTAATAAPPELGCVIEPCGTTTTTAAPSLTQPTREMEIAAQQEVNRIMRKIPSWATGDIGIDEDYEATGVIDRSYYTRSQDRRIPNGRIRELCKITHPDLSDTTRQYFTLEVREPIITQANRDTGHINLSPHNQNGNSAWCDVVPRLGQNLSLGYSETPRPYIRIYTNSWITTESISISAENWPTS